MIGIFSSADIASPDNHLPRHMCVNNCFFSDKKAATLETDIVAKDKQRELVSKLLK